MGIARTTVTAIYESARFKLYAGVSGSADEAAKALMSMATRLDPDSVAHLSRYDKEHVCVPQVCDCIPWKVYTMSRNAVYTL